MESRSIAVIGAGFSGALLTVHLLRRCRDDDRVYLIERNERFGRGLAFSTGNPRHLLNVRSENMSAFPDEPLHFQEWLDRQPESAIQGSSRTPGIGHFVPRSLYGTYIQELLGNEIWAGGKARHLYIVNDEAVGLETTASGLSVEVAGGRRYAVDSTALALGNFAPGGDMPGYFGDPWHPDATAGLAPAATVLLVGTGLTMVDMVVSLLDDGHQGPIVALSRRGLLPSAHRPKQAWSAIPVPDLSTVTVRGMVRLLRREFRRAEAAGVGWQAVIDAVRPITQAIWRAWPLEEKKRFLRHARPFWDVHRHRAAPSTAAMIQDAIDRGQLTVVRGRLLSMAPAGEGLTATWRPRGADAVEAMWVERVINCTGPSSDYARIDHPLIRSLLDQGLARPDPLALGLDISATGALLDHGGAASGRLFAVGPVTRGGFWEITAVPDIRAQCLEIARTMKPARVDAMFL